MHVNCATPHTVSLYITYRSYTTFKYSNLSITPTIIKAGQNVSIGVTVTNVGDVPSDEVCIHAI